MGSIWQTDSKAWSNNIGFGGILHCINIAHVIQHQRYIWNCKLYGEWHLYETLEQQSLWNTWTWNCCHVGMNVNCWFLFVTFYNTLVSLVFCPQMRQASQAEISLALFWSWEQHQQTWDNKKGFLLLFFCYGLMKPSYRHSDGSMLFFKPKSCMFETCLGLHVLVAKHSLHLCFKRSAITCKECVPCD